MNFTGSRSKGSISVDFINITWSVIEFSDTKEVGITNVGIRNGIAETSTEWCVCVVVLVVVAVVSRTLVVVKNEVILMIAIYNMIDSLDQCFH